MKTIKVDGEEYVLKSELEQARNSEKKENTSMVVRQLLGESLFEYLKANNVDITTDGLNANSWDGSHYYRFSFKETGLEVHETCDIADVGTAYFEDFKGNAHVLFAFCKKVMEYLWKTGWNTGVK